MSTPFTMEGSTLVSYTGSEEEVIVPQGVKEIGKGAFGLSVFPKRIVLPEGLTQIGEAAFESCCNLQEINIPASVKKLMPVPSAPARVLPA